MDKRLLRQHMKAVRGSVEDSEQKSGLIAKAVINFLESYHNVKIVKIFSYVSMGSEVDTFKLLEYYINKDLFEVFIPRTGDGKMELVRLESMPKCVPDSRGNLVEYGSAAAYSENVDIAIVPLLAFNKTRHRLGYGGGYYDRFLASNRVLSIGIAFDEQFRPDFKEDEWDKPLDMIFTPTLIL